MIKMVMFAVVQCNTNLSGVVLASIILTKNMGVPIFVLVGAMYDSSAPPAQ